MTAHSRSLRTFVKGPSPRVTTAKVRIQPRRWHGSRPRLLVRTASISGRVSAIAVLTEKRFSHICEETHALFNRLFDDGNDPIQLMYESLAALSCDKSVMTAQEPDGRRYGPAIIRAHYGGYTYAPHFDSVRLREKRADYAVHQFDHQFAGVLVLQNTHLADRTAQCRLHRCLWNEGVDPHLKAGTFHEYAAEQNVPSVEVVLEPGDLYFFNTRCIHEVPGVAGDLPRIVLATFIGYSSDREEIFVWS